MTLSLAAAPARSQMPPTQPPLQSQPSSPPPPTASPGPDPSSGPSTAVPEASPRLDGDDLPIDVTWLAPEGCPDANALKREIRRVAGTIPPATVRPEARAVVRRGRSPIWQLTLTTKAGAAVGERRLTASDCGELMRAAALVMALMINPNAGISLPPEPPPPPPVVLAPPPPPPPPTRHLASGLDLMVGTGMVPELGTGFGLRLAAGGRRFFAQVRGGYWLSQEAFVSDRPEAGGSFRALDLGGAGCVRFRPDRRLSPGFCGGLLIVRSQGDGLGVSAPSQATAWWNVALGEVHLRIRVGARHALRIGVEGALPLERPPTFALRGIGPVFQPSASGARGTVGWEVYF